jgi:hypothetical protein
MNKKAIKSDLARIDRMKDSEIDYSDIPALDETSSNKGVVVLPTHSVKKQTEAHDYRRYGTPDGSTRTPE